MQISTQDDWFIAIEQGDWATVEINAETYHGSRNFVHETGLMCAARKNYVDVAKVLMNYEAKLRDHNGYTALMFACENDAIDVARLLMGVESHIFLFDGRTPLHIACEAGSNACVDLLAKSLGKIRDKQGRTSLLSAAEAGNVEAISMILSTTSFSQKELQMAKNLLRSLGISCDDLSLKAGATSDSTDAKNTSNPHDNQSKEFPGHSLAGYTHGDPLEVEHEQLLESAGLVPQLKAELKRKNAIIEQLNAEVERLKLQLSDAQQLVKQKNAELAIQNIAGNISSTTPLYRFVSLTPPVARIDGPAGLSNILVVVPVASLPGKVATTDVMWVRDVQHVLDAKARELAMLYDIITILSGLFLDTDEPLAKELLLLCHTARTTANTSSLYDNNVCLDDVLTCLPDTAELVGAETSLPRSLLKNLKEKKRILWKVSDTLTERVRTCIHQEYELSGKVEYLESERAGLLEKMIEMRTQSTTLNTQLGALLGIDEAVQTFTDEGLLHDIKTLLVDQKIFLPFLERDDWQMETSGTDHTRDGVSISTDTSCTEQVFSTSTMYNYELGLTSFNNSYLTAARKVAKKSQSAYVSALESNIARAAIKLAQAYQKLRTNDNISGISALTTDSVTPSFPAFERARAAYMERATSPIAEFEHKELLSENKRLHCIIDELKQAINTTPLETDSTKDQVFEQQLMRLVSVPQSQITGKGITVGPQTIAYLRAKLFSDLQLKDSGSRGQGKGALSAQVPFIGAMDPESARLHQSYSKLAQPVSEILESLVDTNITPFEASLKAEIAHRDALHLTAPVAPSDADTVSLFGFSEDEVTGGDKLDKVPSSMRTAALTPLMVAVYSKSPPDVERYMAYAGQARLDGTTALMLAAELGFIEAIKLLKSAEERFIRDDGKTALKIARENGHSEAVALLSRASSGDLPSGKHDTVDEHTHLDLHNAVINFNIEEVRKLAMHHTKERDYKGRTALMVAASIGNVDAVEVLLQLEAGLQDASGTTALMLAAEQGNLDCVRLLSSHEKDIHDNLGYDALFYMARSKVCIPPEILRQMQEYLL